jgi:serine/threonine protein kinase
VKLLLDSKSALIAVKTLRILNYVWPIQRKPSILKILKHPLIPKSQGTISDISDHNSAIVTEFARNGSLVSHLPLSRFRLSAARRITKVVIRVALGIDLFIQKV